MYIMYIDESGDTISLSQKGKSFLVLTGCVIEEKDKLLTERKFRIIKRRYYQDPDIEIKSNFLRYANPALKQDSPIKLKDRQKYDQLETDITKFLRTIPVSLFSAVIHKRVFWSKYPAKSAYELAYILLCEQFQKFLEANKSLGICIIDPREGQVEKSYIGKDLDKVHDAIRWKSGGFWHRCPRIIERVLFSSSDKTIGIQLADLYCYPVFHIFEYDKTQNEYWRFKDITLTKLRGLKFFPQSSKKDLRYFG